MAAFDMKNYTKIVLLLSISLLVILLQYYVIIDTPPNVGIRDAKTVNAYVPPIYVITPTYVRPAQIPELVRLSQTLMLVPNVTWLVVEDGTKKNELVEKLLKKSGLTYRYLLAPMPDKFKSVVNKQPKGVSNRNKGVEWVRRYADLRGVFYFADDDNTYDAELFAEIRETKTVSMFPVGLVTETGLSSPILSENCSFLGFYDGWIGGRKFPVDMAGFAVSVGFLLDRPNATMPFVAGYEEDGFLKSLEPFEAKDAQFLASCCTRILVWHTQTVRKSHAKPLNMTVYPNNCNINTLNKLIV